MKMMACALLAMVVVGTGYWAMLGQARAPERPSQTAVELAQMQQIRCQAKLNNLLDKDGWTHGESAARYRQYREYMGPECVQ